MKTRPERVAVAGVPDEAGEITELARGGGLNLLGSIVNTAAVLALTIVLARQLGKEATGVYVTAFALRRILSTAALGGMRAAMNRFVAIHLVDDDDAALRGTLRLGIAVSVGLATLLGLLLWFAAPWLDDVVYNTFGIQSALRWVAVGLPVAAFTTTVLAATQGFRTMRPSALIGNVLEPVTRVVLTIIALAAGWGLDGALAMLNLASVVAAIAAFLALRRLMAGHRRETPFYLTSEILHFASITWVSSVTLEGIRWVDTQILAIFAGPAIVAEYVAASRLVLLATLAVNAVTAALAPRAADLIRRHRIDILRRLYVVSATVLVRITAPLLVVVFVNAEDLLRVFGPEFVAGAIIARLLVPGMLVDAATSPGGPVLNMAGFINSNLAINVSGLALNVALNLALVPPFGAVGAAVAWSVSLSVMGAARAVVVRRRVVGVYPVSERMWLIAVASLLAMAVGIGLQLWLQPAWAVFAVAPIMLTAYGVATWLLGIEPEERQALRSLAVRGAG